MFKIEKEIRRITTIVLITTIAVIVFRAGIFPYAVFISQNNGLSDSPLMHIVIGKIDEPRSGDTIVVCRELRCGLVEFRGYTEFQGRVFALVKSTDAGAPYPVPADDVKYRIIVSIPPTVYAPLSIIIIAVYVYKVNIIDKFKTSTGISLLILSWIILLVLLTAFALPAPPRNPLDIPQVRLDDVDVETDYTITAVFEPEGLTLGQPQSCIATVPRGQLAFEAIGTINNSILSIRLEPEEWLDIASTIGRQAEVTIDCIIPIVNFNGTLRSQFPVTVVFNKINIINSNDSVVLFNPNPFPVNISFIINYYDKKGSFLVLSKKISNSTTIEPLGTLSFELEGHKKMTGAIKIYYPWGVRHASFTLP